MQKTKRIALFLAMGLSASALAGSVESVSEAQALREECSALSQADARNCLAQKVKSSQETLKQAEADASRVLSEWDEDEKYVRQAKAKLAEANKAFARYRARQCEFSASLSGGAAGNAHEAASLACIAELNERRAAQIRAAASSLPLK